MGVYIFCVIHVHEMNVYSLMTWEILKIAILLPLMVYNDTEVQMKCDVWYFYQTYLYQTLFSESWIWFLLNSIKKAIHINIHNLKYVHLEIYHVVNNSINL